MKAIEFENVTFRYEEDSPFVIQKLNFSVEEGEFVAVLGHNGSGKSTLARLSNGLLVPDAGAVRVFGVTLSDETMFEARKNVGVVFQNPDNQTVATIVEDDVAFGCRTIGTPPSRASRAGRNSASPSRAFWRSSRASSSSTNPPPCSIRAAGARSWTW